ncbi:hypothetical protein OOZ54_14580 [Rhodopseudomonas palustris]|uniref:hypothetical protein n=1 Tax=Rhodopseudomonas palustris TaxID=1076 RepID=UPI0022EFFB3E|nr:hypothetical protein [Rhodopseudomonas palustris]WBU27885.1 hypothetical protein OOZ54_14580 [Rhodopseudomonas palustris]
MGVIADWIVNKLSIATKEFSKAFLEATARLLPAALLGIITLAIVKTLDIVPNLSDFLSAISAVLTQVKDNAGLALTAIGATIIATVFTGLVRGLQRESKEYARNISQRQEGVLIELASASVGSKSGSVSKRSGIREEIERLRLQVDAIRSAATRGQDISDPNNLFQVSRQRLLDEAVRIDSISRRNLIIGVTFSVIALGVLSWPLVDAALGPEASHSKNVAIIDWLTQSYLPRFAVGLLLQFVGFFFLRLYVANELDLKHNKNEITNIELKMLAVLLSGKSDSPETTKDVISSLIMTERNFVMKKDERSVSMEGSSEYNDLKGIIEQLVQKLPEGKRA